MDVLALQETRRDNSSTPWVIRNYCIIESFPPIYYPGITGLALIVRRGLRAERTDRSTPNILWVTIPWDGRKMHIVNVYLPCEARDKEQVRNKLAQKLRRVLDRGRGDMVVVMGDFNTHPEDMENWLAETELALSIVPMEGNYTYITSKTCVDYFLVNDEDTLLYTTCSTLQNDGFIISDHLCLTTTLKTTPLSSAPVKKVIDRHKVLEDLTPLLSLNRFTSENYPELAARNSAAAVLRFVHDLYDSLDEMGYTRAVGNASSASSADKPWRRKASAQNPSRTENTPRRGRRQKQSKWGKEKYAKRPPSGGKIGCYSFFTAKERRVLAKRRRLLSKKACCKEKTPEMLEEVRRVNREAKKILKEHDLRNSTLFSQLLIRLKPNPSAFWRAINSEIEQREEKVMRIRDPDTNTLVMEDAEVCRAFAKYYTRLVSVAEERGVVTGSVAEEREVVTGSMAEERGGVTGSVAEGGDPWEGTPLLKPKGERMCMDAAYWNAPIKAEEVKEAIRNLDNGKSSGSDAIPAEVYKKIARSAEGNGAAAFRLLVDAVNTLFNGFIPEELQSSIVVSVFKKGDPTDMDNYRGISLMPVLLKIACSVVASRLSHAFEEENMLTDAQAGFRPGQECAGHVVALLEIIERWRSQCAEYTPVKRAEREAQSTPVKNAEREAQSTPSRNGPPGNSLTALPTYTGKKQNRKGKVQPPSDVYVCFIDFRKAYDTVPHGALFYKLRRYGVTGKTYAFLHRLYEASTLRIRIGDSLSEPIRLQRGLRQGCPLSPILFSIFINDILPEKPNREYPWDPTVECLLYADDLCLFARTPHRLQQLMDAVSVWTLRWHMTVGVNKCGVMRFPKHSHSRRRKELLRKDRIYREEMVPSEELSDTSVNDAWEDELSDPWDPREDERARTWLLQGQAIPVVDHYTYLGLEITPSLDRTVMITKRANAANRMLWLLRPLLVNQSIPLPIRADIVRTKLLPCCTYGAEVWGGVKDDCQMELVMQRAMELLVKGKVTRNTCPHILAIELDITPVYTLALEKRTRIITCGHHMSRVLHDLLLTINTFGTYAQTPIKGVLRVGGSAFYALSQKQLQDEASSQGRSREGGEVQKRSREGGEAQKRSREGGEAQKRSREGGEVQKRSREGGEVQKRQRLQQLATAKEKRIATVKEGDFFLDFCATKQDQRSIGAFRWFGILLASDAKALKEYILNGKPWNRCYLDAWYQHPELARGFSVILRMRTYTWVLPNHLWTGKENLSWKCPSCRDDGRETIEHYILYCPAYHADRQVMMRTIAAAEGVEEKFLQQMEAQAALPPGALRARRALRKQRALRALREQREQRERREQEGNACIACIACTADSPRRVDCPEDCGDAPIEEDVIRDVIEPLLLRVLGLLRWDPFITPHRKHDNYAPTLEEQYCALKTLSTAAPPLMDSVRSPHANQTATLLHTYLDQLFFTIAGDDSERVGDLKRERERMMTATTALATFLQNTSNRRHHFVTTWLQELRMRKMRVEERGVSI